MAIRQWLPIPEKLREGHSEMEYLRWQQEWVLSVFTWLMVGLLVWAITMGVLYG